MEQRILENLYSLADLPEISRYWEHILLKKEFSTWIRRRRIPIVKQRNVAQFDWDLTLTERKFNPDSQVIVSKWLQDESVRRGCLCPVDDLPVWIPCHKDNWRMCNLSYPSRDLDPINGPRKPYIEEDKWGWFSLHEREGICCIFSLWLMLDFPMISRRPWRQVSRHWREKGSTRRNGGRPSGSNCTSHPCGIMVLSRVPRVSWTTSLPKKGKRRAVNGEWWIPRWLGDIWIRLRGNNSPYPPC